MTTPAAPKDTVTIWLVIEEDRGMGITVESAHASEDAAKRNCGSHCYVHSVPMRLSDLFLTMSQNFRSGPIRCLDLTDVEDSLAAGDIVEVQFTPLGGERREGQGNALG